MDTHAWEPLGFVRLADYARERAGASARELRELARVDARLAELPGLEQALVGGRMSWTKVRELCRVARPCDEEWWLHFAERCSTHELAKRVRVVEREARGESAASPLSISRADSASGASGDPWGGEAASAAELPSAREGESDAEAEAEPFETFRIHCDRRVSTKWGHVRRLARRVTGEWLPAAAIAECVAAELMSTLPFAPDDLNEAAPPARAAARERDRSHSCEAQEPAPCSDRAPADTRISDRPVADYCPAQPRPDTCAAEAALLEEWVAGLAEADAFELDRRLRGVLALERGLLCRMAPRLATVADRKLFRGLGLHGLDAYARERLGMSPRKARSLLRVERACCRAPALRTAWRDGRISWTQVQVLAALAFAEGAQGFQVAWVERAERISVRRLEDDVDRALETCDFDPAALPVLPEPIEVAPTGLQMRARPTSRWHRNRVVVCGPPDVVRFFRAALAAVRLQLERGSGRPASPAQALEAICDHVLDVWTRGERALSPAERRFHRTFARDGWRCTVPGCRSLRELHAHHVVFRSRGGSDAPENLTTLCAAHHHRAVHSGRIRIRGRAPEGLRFDMPLGSWRAGDFKEVE